MDRVRPRSPLSLFDHVEDLGHRYEPAAGDRGDAEDAEDAEDLCPPSPPPPTRTRMVPPTVHPRGDKHIEAKNEEEPSYPRVVPPSMRASLHSATTCIDLYAHEGLSMKCRVGATRSAWTNRVEGRTASISVNTRTQALNSEVWAGKPVHLLTFHTGADTYYHGRYTCIGGTPATFELERLDHDERARALLQSMPTVEQVVERPLFRSRLEETWAERFKACSIEVEYEPITLRVRSKEYTPDFVIAAPPHAPLLVEIKGAVVNSELELCSAVALKGFHIVLIFGDVDDFCANSCFEFLPYTSESRRSVPALMRTLLQPAM